MKKIIAYFSLALVLFAFLLLPVKAQSTSDASPEYSFLFCQTDNSTLDATFTVSPGGINIRGLEQRANSPSPFAFDGTFNSFVEQQDYFSLPVEIKSGGDPEDSPFTFVPRNGILNSIQDLRIYQPANRPPRLDIAEIERDGVNPAGVNPALIQHSFTNCRVSNLALIRRSISNRSVDAYDCQCAQTSGNRMGLSIPFTSLIDQTKKACRYSRSSGELSCRKLSN